MADGSVPVVPLTCYVGEDFTPSFCVGTRILTSSKANPCVIVTDGPHGFRSGQTVFITRHVGSVPTIDGSYVVTVIDAQTFTIPVNCTTGGYEGFVTSLTNDISTWTLVMTIKDSDTSPTFTKTINAVVTSGTNREFNVPVTAAVSATIPVGTHKYDIWRTNAGSAWVLEDNAFTVKSERRVTPP